MCVDSRRADSLDVPGILQVALTSCHLPLVALLVSLAIALLIGCIDDSASARLKKDSRRVATERHGLCVRIGVFGYRYAWLTVDAECADLGGRYLTTP